jgi:predicted RNase H-like HicB family nuclease
VLNAVVLATRCACDSSIEAEIRDAIRFHIEGLQADGVDVPEPTSIAEYVEA